MDGPRFPAPDWVTADDFVGRFPRVPANPEYDVYFRDNEVILVWGTSRINRVRYPLGRVISKARTVTNTSYQSFWQQLLFLVNPELEGMLDLLPDSNESG